MNKLKHLIFDTRGDNGAMITLRLILAYEFFTAGMMKLNGSNWFADGMFPFPFSLFSPEFNWGLVTGFELLLPVLLVLGFMTRFAALGLIVITIVAWVSIHTGGTYTISDNGFRMPLIFLTMLMPILISGSGKFGLDYLIGAKDK